MIVLKTILELDIVHASPSIWYEEGYIDKEKYEELISMDKRTRVIKTGLMRKDNSILTEALYNGYNKYIAKLKEANNIQDSDILYTDHDAVWLIDTAPDILEFGNVHFAIKNVYEMMYMYKHYKFFIESITQNLVTKGVQHLDDSPLLALIKSVMIDYMNKDREMCYRKLHKAKKALAQDYEAYGPSLTNSPVFNLQLVNNMIILFT